MRTGGRGQGSGRWRASSRGSRRVRASPTERPRAGRGPGFGSTQSAACRRSVCPRAGLTAVQKPGLPGRGLVQTPLDDRQPAVGRGSLQRRGALPSGVQGPPPHQLCSSLGVTFCISLGPCSLRCNSPLLQKVFRERGRSVQIRFFRTLITYNSTRFLYYFSPSLELIFVKLGFSFAIFPDKSSA